MRFTISCIAIFITAATALSKGPTLNLGRRQCEIAKCPDGWSSSSCNGNLPNFCCPGSSSINVVNGVGSAACCIGGILQGTEPGDQTCQGGVLVSLGSDEAAYTSSVYAALSSVSGDSAAATTIDRAEGSSTRATEAASAVTTTDASGNAVTTTLRVDTTSSDGGAAAMVTGVSGAVMGVFAVVIVAVDVLA
jgi:hypothetical protein